MHYIPGIYIPGEAGVFATDDGIEYLTARPVSFSIGYEAVNGYLKDQEEKVGLILPNFGVMSPLPSEGPRPRVGRDGNASFTANIITGEYSLDTHLESLLHAVSLTRINPQRQWAISRMLGRTNPNPGEFVVYTALVTDTLAQKHKQK